MQFQAYWRLEGVMVRKSSRAALQISEEERSELARLSQSRTAPRREVERAAILLGYADGQGITEIQRALHVSRPTIYKCIDKALAAGVSSGLKDRFHRPREPVITESAKAWVTDLACRKPCELGLAAELWTLSELARYTRKHAPAAGHASLAQAGKATIWRILNVQVIEPHIGGARTNDSQCALCHDAASIPVYHAPVTPPNPQNALLAGGTNNNTAAAWIASNVNNLPAGAIKVTYEVSSVSRNASKQPVIVFRLLQNGARKDLNVFATATANPATGQKEICDNFMGAPSVYFVWAVPQDGITAPADFNASANSYIRSLWNGTASGAGAGTLTGPDANGFYTATLTGVTVPDSAVMLTGAIGYSYGLRTTMPLTQTNLPDYPTAAATATSGLTAGMPNRTGGLIVIAPDTQRVATGYTGRRAIVEDARCNKCHLELGVFTEESFHTGRRNDGTTCSWCHTPNRTSSGWSADSTYYIHAIHAADKRTVPFTWHAVSTTESLAKILFPGILSNCETCHLPGTYDFSATASAAALPNRLYRTAATGIFNGTAGTVTTGTTTTQTELGVFSLSPYVVKDNATDYGSGFSFNAATGVTRAAAGTTLVNSPIAGVSFACHDTDLAKQHMESNGGSIYQPRTAALAELEQCTLCHLSGRVADIKTMHAK